LLAVRSGGFFCRNGAARRPARELSLASMSIALPDCTTIRSATVNAERVMEIKRNRHEFD
jgi:hypothetical protein